MLVINEYLPAPDNVDWDGDGTASVEDEWIELYNPGTGTVDLAGWQLDDTATGGSAPFTFPSGAQIEAGDFLLIFRQQSGIALDDDGDDVRLLRPDGTIQVYASYSHANDDASWARDINGVWHHDWSPTPGAPNVPPPTATPAPTATATPTVTPTFTATASPTATATATVTPTATMIPAGLLLNEFLPHPATDWTGDDEMDANDEYIELINTSSQPFDLNGLQLDDASGGSAPFTLNGILTSGEIRVYFRSETDIALNDSGGDEARLLAPNGDVLDSYSYPSVAQDQAWSRDESGIWRDDWPPSPGAPNMPPPTPTPTLTATATSTATATRTPSTTPTATATASVTASPTATATATTIPIGLLLNEFLPRPESDWNGDDLADVNDEYIELANTSSQPFDLNGLQLDDAGGGSAPFPLSGILTPGEIRVYFRSETDIALNDSG
ncbi:MAG: lamin tail domain-containing protein, partial [Ardenticatenaceae bacterium]